MTKPPGRMLEGWPQGRRGEIRYPVMMLTPEERKDRAIVNDAVRTGRTPLRPAGSADHYGVPLAEE